MISTKMRSEVKELAVQELQILFRQYARRPNEGLAWLLISRVLAFLDDFGEQATVELLRSQEIDA